MVRHDEVYQQREDASRRAATNILTKVGVSLEKLDRYIIETPDDEHYITSIMLKMRFDDMGDVLGIIKSDTGEGKVLAFHNGDSIADVLVGISNRLGNGTLKWREDLPYGER